MSTYAIGDLQGCFDELQQLLKKIKFNPAKDTLWFVGDLVNRGPKSLECLRFVKSLGSSAITVLGNHDLSCLARWRLKQRPPITLRKLFKAKDAEELMYWLERQPLAHYDIKFNKLMVHAGVPPKWSLSQTMLCATELSLTLQSKKKKKYYRHMYGNKPEFWREKLTGYARLRYITNALTRMRFCTLKGGLDLKTKSSPSHHSKKIKPWFSFDHPLPLPDIIFGHWAALMGKTGSKHFIAVDTGCVWGHNLTAYRLDDGKYFSVKAKKSLKA